MPLDRGVIDQQLQALGEGSRWWDVRELRDLPAVLHEDERILAIARGRIARGRWMRRPWLILITDERLLCMRSGARASWRQLEVPAAQIGRISLRVGPFRGRVLFIAGGRKYRLLVTRPDAHKLLSALSLLNTSARQAVGGFGPTRMVRQVIDHMLALPAVALAPGDSRGLPAGRDEREEREERSRMEARLDGLEEQVQALQQQVAFLEQLLGQRQSREASRAGAGAGAGSGTVEGASADTIHGAPEEALAREPESKEAESSDRS